MSFLHGTNKSVDPALSNVNFARLSFRDSLSTVSFVIDTDSTKNRTSMAFTVALITDLTLMKKGT